MALTYYLRFYGKDTIGTNEDVTSYIFCKIESLKVYNDAAKVNPGDEDTLGMFWQAAQTLSLVPIKTFKQLKMTSTSQKNSKTRRKNSTNYSAFLKMKS